MALIANPDSCILFKNDYFNFNPLNFALGAIGRGGKTFAAGIEFILLNKDNTTDMIGFYGPMRSQLSRSTRIDESGPGQMQGGS